ARQVFAFGAAKEDAIFEIGSISKTFTGLLLGQLAEQGKVELGEPARELIPRGIVARPHAREITLLDLATHRSGLPAGPDNFSRTDAATAYRSYTVAEMYEFLSRHGVERSATTSFEYSNYGFALLGQALANRAAMSYPELLRQNITVPLGMR